jgi:gluconolactonase
MITVSSPKTGVRIIAAGLELPESPVALADGSVPMITNLCFGGPDYRTAFITCSGTGHLIAVDWPRPGGRLAFPTSVTT